MTCSGVFLTSSQNVMEHSFGCSIFLLNRLCGRQIWRFDFSIMWCFKVLLRWKSRIFCPYFLMQRDILKVEIRDFSNFAFVKINVYSCFVMYLDYFIFFFHKTEEFFHQGKGKFVFRSIWSSQKRSWGTVAWYYIP